MAASKTAQGAQIVSSAPMLTVLLVKDDGHSMAKCVELDLITEMDTPQEALQAIVEMMREYAEDYRERENLFLASPNRAQHKPYIDRILACRDEWAVWELLY
jgi:predicted RNase H-like HicB family nuclease